MGINLTTGFAFTDVAGQAQFCYVGSVAGQDLISGTVGTIVSNTVVKIWTGAPSIKCDADNDGRVTVADLLIIRNANGQIASATRLTPAMAIATA